MHHRMAKTDAQEARGAEGEQQEVWAWIIIGVVATLTLLVVWVPLLFAAFHA